MKRQLIYIFAGTVFCILLQFVHYKLLKHCALLIYSICILLIFFLLTPAGVSVNGATRWLGIGGVQFQVAEVVKIGVIIFLSYMVQRYYKHLRNWRLVLYMWIAGGGAAVLLWRISNDLSSAIVILGITFGITFVFTELDISYQSVQALYAIGRGGIWGCLVQYC